MDEDTALRERLNALREENEFLRQAARTFGELAERLAGELYEIRSAASQPQNPASPRNDGAVASRADSPVAHRPNRFRLRA